MITVSQAIANAYRKKRNALFKPPKALIQQAAGSKRKTG
jgi:hypothetical protein